VLGTPSIGHTVNAVERNEIVALLALGLSVALGFVQFFRMRAERLAQERSTARVRVAIREPTERNKLYQPMKGQQLHLVADFKAEGGNVIIQETWLMAGDPKRPVKRVKGRRAIGTSGRADVLDGLAERREWALVLTRELPADEPWFIAWQDTRGNVRDSTAVPDAYRHLLATAKTAAEAAAEHDSE
jgi:hypothetical protein